MRKQSTHTMPLKLLILFFETKPEMTADNTNTAGSNFKLYSVYLNRKSDIKVTDTHLHNKIINKVFRIFILCFHIRY